METVVAIKLGETTIKQEILDIGEVHDEVEPVVPIKLEEGATIKQGFRDMGASRRTLSVANSAVFVCHHCGCEGKSLEDMRRHMRRHRGLSVGDQVSRVEEVKRDTKTLDIKEVYDEVELAAPIKLDEAVFKQEILAIGEVHNQVEHVDPIKLEEGATIKQEILDIREIYDDHAPIKDEHCSDDDTDARLWDELQERGQGDGGKRRRRGIIEGRIGFRDLDASSKTISVAYTGVFVCHHCGCKRKSLEDMRGHMRRHRGLSVGDQVSRVEEVRRDTSMCRGLGEATKFSNLKMSKMVNTGKKLFSCDQCNYRTSHLGTLKIHKRVHTGEKPFSCDQCDYKARCLSTLTRHKRIHNGEKPFSCDQCVYTASQSSYLKIHKRVHTGEKPFFCDQCNYRASHLGYLKSHKRVHTGEKPFLCDQCNYRAGQLSCLKNHKRTHTGEKPFSCDQCDYTASRLATLTRHKRIHTREKPFSCDQCDYTASRLATLTRHKRIHTREKPFSCDQCDYTASRLATLTRHKRIHTREKPFSCDRCDYTASRLCNLTRHKRIHTGEKTIFL
ncbi:hypothetical protein AAG570_007406 [Ranatra chinensis]|uniref:C2H2-type domain-containing protein n=1 Tax=Ranatra chinensis TaxID=642074 RepID=A0ABD0XVT2_9HEMI